MLERITQNPITSWSGVVILAIGAGLLALSKISLNEFWIFVGLAGIGFGSKDPRSHSKPPPGRSGG